MTLAWGLSSALNNSTEHLNTVQQQRMPKSKSLPEGFGANSTKDMTLPLVTNLNGGLSGVKDDEMYVMKYVENMVLLDFLDPMNNK